MLNSKTDYYETSRTPAVARCLQDLNAGKIAFWFLAIFFGGALIMVACGITLH